MGILVFQFLPPTGKSGYPLNARSSQTQDGFEIVMHRGIIENSFRIIGLNIDYYSKKYAKSLDKEFCMVIGCNIIWTALYGHELGHILRGHLINYPGNSCQTVDQPESLAAFGEIAGYPFDRYRTRLLMEFDADVCSAAYITRQIIEFIEKAERDEITNAESIVDIAISSLFFYFQRTAQTRGRNHEIPSCHGAPELPIKFQQRNAATANKASG